MSVPEGSRARLSGRVAVVTGAASGIGAAVVARFLDEGANVLAVDRDAFAQPSADASRLEQMVLDVTQASAAVDIVGTAAARFGSLDILVNNAGVCDYADVVDCEDAIWDRAIAINLTAMFRLSRAAAPGMKARGRGRIINTASIMAERSYAGLAAYASSKHAVAGLTRTLAIELGPHGITANYILPGAIVTGITVPLIDGNPGLGDVYADMSVMRRMGTPDEVAAAFAFLASDDASFITGHGLAVDGGALLKV